MLRAAQDGADIINLSLGALSEYSDGITVTTAELVSKAGHVVVAAIGNEGMAGAYDVNNPGTSFGAVGVASFDNVKAPFFSLFVDSTPYPYFLGSTNSSFAFGTPYAGEIVVNTPNAVLDNVLDDGCTTINVDVKDKAVLLYWGIPNACGSAKRCNNAALAGASACFIYYQNNLLDIGILGGIIPSLITSLSGGQAIIADLAKNKSSDVVPTQLLLPFPFYAGGYLSPDSSPGLTPELFLKPDIGAIGGYVYSTYSDFAAKYRKLSVPYGFVSGTSGSSAYVAGCVALLMQKRGKLDFGTVKSLLMNTASVGKIYHSSNILPPSYQGAGLVNVYKAATTGTTITPASISLNDTAHFRKYTSIRIQNNNLVSVTYNIWHVPAATANTFHAGDDFVLSATETTFTTNMTATVKIGGAHGNFKGRVRGNVIIPAGKATYVGLEFTAPVPASTDLWPMYGGYIAIGNSIDDIVVHVPYAGVAGVWKDRDIWARNSTSLYENWALGLNGSLGLYGVVPASTATGLYANKSFTPLKRMDVVNALDKGFILAPAASTSRSAKITITYLCKSDKPLRQLGLNRVNIVKDFGFLPRDTYIVGSRVSVPKVYLFDGTVNSGNKTVQIPAGVYQINFIAWKNFGNSSELDVVRTPPFQLIYDQPLSGNALAACRGK